MSDSEKPDDFLKTLEGMLKERAGGISKCLSCGYNPRRDENPPNYECKGGRKAGLEVYSCERYTKPENVKPEENKKKRFKLF
jgi:hypothetical protein